MADESKLTTVNQNELTRKRGGARPGAGRKPLDYDARWFAARGINPLTAAEILAHVADERTLWRRVLSSKDDRVVLSALQFLVQMRDGKPAQSINVNSQSISIAAKDIESARAIISEIRGELATSSASPRLGLASPLTVDANAVTSDKPLDTAEDFVPQSELAAPVGLPEAIGERKAKTMLSVTEGGK